MSRHPLRVLIALVAGVVLMLAGCSDDTASGSPEPAATSEATTAAPTTTVGDLRSACKVAGDVIEETIQQLFDHPNDFPFAAKVYAEGAVKLRKVSAGTPIEAEINKVAAVFETYASELRRGYYDGDGSRLPKAGEPLAKACT